MRGLGVLILLGISGLLIFSSCEKTKAQIYNWKAQTAHDNGHYEAAIENYKKSLEADPGLVQNEYNLGVAYINMGQVENAKAQVKKLKSLDEDHYADELTKLIRIWENSQ